MKKNVLLVGLVNIKNFGDSIIYNCTKILLKKELKSYNLINLDLNITLPVVYRIINRLSIKIGWNSINSKLMLNGYKRNIIKTIKEANAIVFVGGGLIKFKYQDFWIEIAAIIDLAEKFNIPVYFNAVGIEGYDNNDFRCQILKRYLNKNNIKILTTRDDLETLNNYYIENPNIKTYKTADPAIFTSEIYKINKKNKDIIGIGLIRENIFIDNEINYDGQKIKNFYIDLIIKLQQKGKIVQLFTNGLKDDLIMAKDICNSCKLDYYKSVVIPNNSIDLIEIISNYKCVIAFRLHACIISYSLDIPAIGIVWNNKLKFWGETINQKNRFININKLSALSLIDLIEKSIAEGYRCNRKQIEKSQLKSICEIASNIKTTIENY